MRLILAHDHDRPARVLAGRWDDRALLLTAADLHRARWGLELDPDGLVRTDLADSSGKPVPVTGVVNRLGLITAADLPRVRRPDRQYAAAELTAFLLAWLDACPAPVLNRPSAGSLNGPAWHPEQWAEAAVWVGLRADGSRHRIRLGAPPMIAEPLGDNMISASVVVDRCFGGVHSAVAEKLCALARQADTPLLGATVSGAGPRARVRAVSAWPDVADPEVADALADVFAVPELARRSA